MNRWSLTVSETVWNHAKVIFEVRCFMITGNFDSLWTRDKKCPICMSHINNQSQLFRCKKFGCSVFESIHNFLPSHCKHIFQRPEERKLILWLQNLPGILEQYQKVIIFLQFSQDTIVSELFFLIFKVCCGFHFKIYGQTKIFLQIVYCIDHLGFCVFRRVYGVLRKCSDLFCFFFQLFRAIHRISLISVTVFRSCHRKCSIKRAVLKNFAKFTGNRLCQTESLL